MQNHGNFCVSYEEIRKHDIGANGIDYECHKNDEELQDATLCLNKQDLSELFASVGLADKDGKFPITDLKDKSKKLDEVYSNEPDKNIQSQFLLLKRVCPDFALCQDESISVLRNILLNNDNLKSKFNENDRCAIKKVYDKDDEEKKPVLYVHIDADEIGRKFYYANKDEAQFVELSEEEFTNKFECYDMDLQASKGIRPWENTKQIKEAAKSQKNFEIRNNDEGEER